MLLVINNAVLLSARERIRLISINILHEINLSTFLAKLLNFPLLLLFISYRLFIFIIITYIFIKGMFNIFGRNKMIRVFQSTVKIY